MKNTINIQTCGMNDALFEDFVSAAEHSYGYIDRLYLITCVVAYRNTVPSGRLCIYYNPQLLYQNLPVLLFGNFDFVHDNEVCKCMLEYVEKTAVKMNIHYIVGPVNGSTWNEYRFPVSGEKAAFTGDTHQPLYYSGLLVDCGYHILHRYASAVSNTGEATHPDTDTWDQLSASGVNIRGIDTADYAGDLEKIYEVSAASFTDNALFSPIDKTTFINKYLQYERLVDKNFVLVAEQARRVIAFAFAYPDQQSLSRKRLVIKTLARHPEYRIQGLISTMIQLLYKHAEDKGYTEIIHAFMHLDNKSLVLSQLYGGHVIREYAVFIKQAGHE